MDRYLKTEMVEAEQWNKPGDVKEAGVEKVGYFWKIGGHRTVRPGDYIIKGYDIQTDSPVYYPIPKEDFEGEWSKIGKPEWEGD
jgi:hypothetical protein